MKSSEKVSHYLEHLDELVAGAGDDGEQLRNIIGVARGFGIDPAGVIGGLLPLDDPDRLDTTLVALALYALRARSDDANPLVISVAGGTIEDMIETRGGEAIVHIIRGKAYQQDAAAEPEAVEVPVERADAEPADVEVDVGPQS